MSMDIKIINGRGNKSKASVSDDGFLRVDTKPYYEYKNAVRYFVNNTYGRNMNINASPSASTNEDIHNGEDDTYWTASVIEGGTLDFDFSSTDQSYNGTQSFRWNAEDGDIAQFLHPGGVDLDLSSFIELSGYVYFNDWDQTGVKEVLFYGYDTGTDSIIGNTVNLADYINTLDLNQWQPFIIPLSDMGLSGETINAIRTEIVESGPGGPPRGYLDDFELIGLKEGLISPVDYILSPRKGEYLSVETLNFIFVNSYDSSLLNGTMNNLSYDNIIGYKPINGILYRRFSEEVLEFNIILRSLFDFLSIPDLYITDSMCDGTDTLLKMTYSFIESGILKDSKKDYISLRLADDFSNFKQFRVSAGCKSRSEKYIQDRIE